MRINDEIEKNMKAVKRNAKVVVHSPEELITPETFLAAVQNDGEILARVPDNLKTAELCHIAVKGYGSALEYVPEGLITPELCLEAVRNDGIALEYVPEVLKTEELCLIAVENNADAIEYVPDELETPEMWDIVKLGEEFEFALFCLNEKRKDGKKYRRFFGVPVKYVQEIVKISSHENLWSTLTIVNFPILPKIEPYERTQLSKGIVIECNDKVIGIEVPNVTHFIRVSPDCIERPENYAKYLRSDFVTGVVKWDGLEKSSHKHLVFLLDIERLCAKR